uniref:Coiled-coil domain-containing protein 172 n=1 Tax=Labrus bergylta TaxID=56723 RepID=A0A3Q3NB56_9LABR
MSLDSLFQQILLTEQQLTEQTQKFKEVKVAIIRCQEQIKSNTENLEKSKGELDEKIISLIVAVVEVIVATQAAVFILFLGDFLIIRLSYQAKIKRESTEEREKFLREISRFNSGFCLGGNRETESESQTRTEIQDLERKVESLHKGHSFSLSQHVSEIMFKRNLDWQLKEAEAVTECLRAESLFVSQKPLTDSNCLR